MSITTSLQRAAKLQERIEGLRAQLAELLDRTRKEIAASATEVPLLEIGRSKVAKSNGRKSNGTARSNGTQRKPGRPPAKLHEPVNGSGGKRRKRSPLLGVKRAASPTGPLAPAVVSVLKTKKKPMNVSDILSGLNANGYIFNAADPKKNLAARIYRLKGVRQASAGYFELA
jgi:hypothetical protein